MVLILLKLQILINFFLVELVLLFPRPPRLKARPVIVCSPYESSTLEECDAPSPVFCTSSLLVGGRETSLVILNHYTFSVAVLQMGNSIEVSFPIPRNRPVQI